MRKLERVRKNDEELVLPTSYPFLILFLFVIVVIEFNRNRVTHKQWDGQRAVSMKTVSSITIRSYFVWISVQEKWAMQQTVCLFLFPFISSALLWSFASRLSLSMRQLATTSKSQNSITDFCVWFVFLLCVWRTFFGCHKRRKLWIATGNMTCEVAGLHSKRRKSIIFLSNFFSVSVRICAFCCHSIA